MKKRISTSLIAIIMIVALSFGTTSCTTESDITETQWKVVNIRVKANDWEWNNSSEQWEAFANLPELSKFIYEQGAALGYVFIGTQGVNEVQKPLPYINTYYDGEDDFGNDIIFTETISCDFKLGSPSTVGFFIKSSDLFPDENAPSNYNFRIVLIW